ncbi:MAG TPA: TonB-dependent receptor [Steroidobacteraceae bacterium]|nr:TonB-dependent receptor [Steroidobacteraceae bacterium]
MTGASVLKASFFSCGILALAGAIPATVAAQGAAGAPAASEKQGQEGFSGKIEEIIVTAQQRSENIQEVPITIQAFSGDTLEKAGITGVEGLQLVTPGLTMSRNGNASTPFIRGIGSGASDAGQESAVAMYVDGVYRQAMFTNTSSLSDIERIEVLKGPQGTLYGRNTTGGLIHIITKDPSQEFGGDFSVTGGTYETYEGKGFLTGGLTDTIAASISTYNRRQDKGYGRNLLIGGRVSKRDEDNYRGKIQYKSDDTKITLSGDYAYVQDDRGFAREPVPGAIVGLPNQPDTWTTFNGDFHDIQNAALPQTSPPHRRANGLTRFIGDSQDWGTSLTIEHSFNWFDAISISAYRDASQDLFGDNDFGRPFLAQATVDFFTKNFTQEVRLTSNDKSPFSWIVGAFYLDGDSGNYLEVPLVLVGKSFTKSYSAFAEVGLKFFDDAGTLTLGGRYTIDKRHVRGTVGGNPDFGVPGFPVQPLDPSKRWEEPTYRVVYSHQISSDLMVYGGYNRGFKSGNYNIIPATTEAFDPEIMDAYEVGLKSTLADGRIRLNAAAFYYDYKDLQLQTATDVATEILNAAGAEIKGLEADFSFNVTDRLTLDLGGSYVDGEYTDFKNASVYVPNVDANGQPVGGDAGISIDASGNRLVRTPKYTASAGLTYSQQWGDGALTAIVRGQYQSSMPWEAGERLKEDAYTVLNASVGYAWNNGWGLRIQGQNILDEEYSLYSAAQPFGDNFSAADPATWSATVSYKF